MSVDNAKRLLSNLGLTTGEAEVYTFVASHGNLKCGEISKNIRKNRARVYRTLKTLECRGMVERTIDSPARFIVVPIKKILDLNIERKIGEVLMLKESRKDAQNFWANIKKRESPFQFERFAVIENRKNIYPKVFQMIEDSKEEALVMIGDTFMVNAVRLQLNECILRKASKSKARIRILRNALEKEQNTTYNDPRKGSKRKTRGQILDHFLEPHLNLCARYIIKDIEEAIIFSRIGNNPQVIGEEETCFWTNNKATISILKTLFEKLWANSSFAVSENLILKNMEYSDRSVEEIMKWYA